MQKGGLFKYLEFHLQLYTDMDTTAAWECFISKLLTVTVPPLKVLNLGDWDFN